MNVQQNSTPHQEGILCFGNWIVDRIKTIPSYPAKSLLAMIQNQTSSIGGGATNVAVDLAKMDPTLPVYAGGVIGQDTDGDYILRYIQELNINTQYMRQTNQVPTSYTEVMLDQSDRTRTFFHFPGANALLSYADFIKIKVKAKICYIGYLNVLEEFEKSDAGYGNMAAKTLAWLKEKRFITVADLTSGMTDFNNLLSPCLKYIDYLVISEIEAGVLSKKQVRETNGRIDFNALESASRSLIKKGVQKYVIIHFPEGTVAMGAKYQIHRASSYSIEKKQIVSAVGAGDAFCSGILYGVHQGLPIQKSLDLGSANAYFNLLHTTACEGAVPIKKVNELIQSAKTTKS